MLVNQLLRRHDRRRRDDDATTTAGVFCGIGRIYQPQETNLVYIF